MVFQCINIHQVPWEVLKPRPPTPVFSTSHGTGRMLMHEKPCLISAFFLLYSFLDAVIRLRQLYDQDRPRATGEMLDILEQSNEPGRWKMFIDALKEAGKYCSLCFIVVNDLTVGMVGKIFFFSRHFEIFFLFFPENRL